VLETELEVEDIEVLAEVELEEVEDMLELVEDVETVVILIE
jgi:hypothetical protein